MRPDRFSLVKAWINDERSTPEEAKATWDAMGKEFDENRKAMLMASAESDKIKAMMNKKYGSGTIKYGSEIPQPEIKTPQAIFEFSQRNPAAEGGRMEFGRGGKPTSSIKLLNTAAKKYGYKDFASVPTNTADRSNILRDAKRRESGAPEGKGRPGVKKDYKINTPMKDPEVVKKQMETRKKEYLKTPEGERLQWIADNSKDYDTPDKLKAAYEKHFKHKVGSKADALFNIEKKPGTRGGVGSATGKKINFGLIDGLQNFNTSERGNLMFITKGFSEDELFKGAILQNNTKVQTQFKNLFKDIHKNVSLYSELGPEGIVERLAKDGGNLLNDFDFIKSYSSGGTQTYGGVHSGITRNSLLNLGVPEKHLTSYQTVRKPLQSLEQILVDLKNRGASERYGISNSTAFKIASQLESFLKGQGNLKKDIAAIEKQLGDGKFKQIFGGVNFEHTLAKRFGKDYKYLPRNYLLKGQFTTAAFNQMKKNAFDLPLIDLMKKYEQGKVSGKEVQTFIDDFNTKTNNYADFSFDTKKGKLGYTDTKVSYDLSRYDNPNVARQELIDNIKLTQSDTFQKGMSKTLPNSKEQLKLFKSKEANQFKTMLQKFCGYGQAQGGRIGLSNGSCSLDESQKGFTQYMEDAKNGKISTTSKAGAELAENAAKLAGKSLSFGKLFFGWTVAPEVVLEGAIGLHKYFDKGENVDQILAQSYLTKPLRMLYDQTDGKTGIPGTEELLIKNSNIGPGGLEQLEIQKLESRLASLNNSLEKALIDDEAGLSEVDIGELQNTIANTAFKLKMKKQSQKEGAGLEAALEEINLAKGEYQDKVGATKNFGKVNYDDATLISKSTGRGGRTGGIEQELIGKTKPNYTTVDKNIFNKDYRPLDEAQFNVIENALKRHPDIGMPDNLTYKLNPLNREVLQQKALPLARADAMNTIGMKGTQDSFFKGTYTPKEKPVYDFSEGGITGLRSKYEYKK